MYVDIFLRADLVEERESVRLNVRLERNMQTDVYSVIHGEFLRFCKLRLDELLDLIKSEVQPYISERFRPLGWADAKANSKGILSYFEWKYHIPCLFSSHYVKTIEDEEVFPFLSEPPPGMSISEEEFDTLLKKLQEGIKNGLISSGCEIYHDFNENETKEKRND